ncbi:MAG: tRNA adenosine(34) deaminase TadA [Clostridia bacterium]|nr:tRNA adenosine(34) deaminase TadA [Clostridia bacterium]
MEIKFMYQALVQARRAYGIDEVPVGAVIVKDNVVIARGFNRRESNKDILGHAEIVAMRKASNKLNDWRLTGCDMYVTLEPCAMCVGAAINARIDNIYFGAYDNKAGCCGSVINLTNIFRLNHKTNCQGGILQEECSQLLRDYFTFKRQ